MVIKIVYHFVDSNLGVEIFSKRQGLTGKEEGGVSFGSCSAWGKQGVANDLPWGRKGGRVCQG